MELLGQSRWAFHFYRHLQPKDLAGMCPGISVGDRVSMKTYCGSGLVATVQTWGRWTLFTCWHVLHFLSLPFSANTFHLPGTLLRAFIPFSYFVLWSRPCRHRCFRGRDMRAEKERSGALLRVTGLVSGGWGFTLRAPSLAIMQCVLNSRDQYSWVAPGFNLGILALVALRCDSFCCCVGLSCGL